MRVSFPIMGGDAVSRTTLSVSFHSMTALGNQTRSHFGCCRYHIKNKGKESTAGSETLFHPAYYLIDKHREERRRYRSLQNKRRIITDEA